MKRICSKCGDNFYIDDDEAWKKLCLDCWKKSKNIDPPPTPKQPPLSFDAEMLKRITYLCHPDKHNGSQAAHLATQWLIKQRK